MLIQIALIYRLSVALSLTFSQFLSTQSTKPPARTASSGIEMRLIAGIDAYAYVTRCPCSVAPPFCNSCRAAVLPQAGAEAASVPESLAPQSEPLPPAPLPEPVPRLATAEPRRGPTRPAPPRARAERVGAAPTGGGAERGAEETGGAGPPAGRRRQEGGLRERSVSVRDAGGPQEDVWLLWLHHEDPD